MLLGQELWFCSEQGNQLLGVLSASEVPEQYKALRTWHVVWLYGSWIVAGGPPPSVKRTTLLVGAGRDTCITM